MPTRRSVWSVIALICLTYAAVYVTREARIFGSAPNVTGSAAPGGTEVQTASPTSAQRMAAVSEAIDGLVEGSAEVRAPSVVAKGHSFQAQLTVAPAAVASLLARGSSGSGDMKSRILIDRVKLTPTMTAVLEGPGLEVSPSTGVEQAISLRDPTRWTWSVRANEGGVRTLLIRLSGSFELEGKTIRREFYQHTHQIEVAVGVRGFIEQYWQWLVTTLILPVVAIIWGWFRARRPATTASARTKRR